MAILTNEGHLCGRGEFDRSAAALRSVRFYAGILLVVITLASTSRGQTASIGESEVKAAFLFNFAKFIEWPPGTFPSQTTPIQFCVLGNEPLSKTLRQIVDGKQIDGRTLQVLPLHAIESGRECQIVFVSSSEGRQEAALLKELGPAPVLTVGEMPNFAGEGGIINFAVINSHVTLEVNIDAAARAHLAISSKLLALAKITRDGPSTTSTGRN